MRSRVRLPSKSAIFLILMVLALALSLLPEAWTGWMRGPFQILALPQGPAAGGVRALKDALGEAGAPEPSAADYWRLREENEDLRRLLAQQQAWLADLEQRYDQVCGVREQLWFPEVRILIAPVWGYDSSPRRDVLVIGRGAKHGVRPGQWVAAGAAPGETDGDGLGHPLLRRWLIGRVSEVQTRLSRVRLASDPRFGAPRAGEEVAVARVLADGSWQLGESRYVLTGHGGGRMKISRADADLFREGFDLVVVRPSSELPAMLSIGTIVGSEPLASSALHFDVRVEHWRDPGRLRYVYVIAVGE